MGPDSRFNITASLVAHNRRQVDPASDRRGRLAYVESYDGQADLYVVDRRLGWPRQVTTYPRPKPAMSYHGGYFCWTPDGTSLVYVGEDSQLWAVPDVGGPASQLTDLPGRCSAPTVGPSSRRICFVYETEDSTDVVTGVLTDAPVTENQLTRLNRSDFAFDPCWSPDGALLAWHEWDVPSMPWDEGSIIVASVDGTDRRVVDGGSYGVGQPRFSPDGRFLAYISERSGWANLWVADTGGWTLRHLVDEQAEHTVPAWHPAVRTFAWAAEGGRLSYVRNHRGRQSLALTDLGGETTDVELPGSSFESVDWSSTISVVASGSDLPRSLISVRPGDRPEVIADDGLSAWAAVDLVAGEPISFSGVDGARIHGLVWTPRTRLPAPMVLMCHGGPNGQTKDEWLPTVQYLVERGYVVVAPNFRGSTGYGAEYRQALRGRWGIVDVEDAASAIDWAIDRGVAQPGRVVAWGGSAGGYLVLMLLAKYGERLAGGIDLFGITDLAELARVTHRFEAHYLDRLIGPLPESKRLYEERSPVNLAGEITRPVLIVQGTDDVAVPPAQSEAIHHALQGAGVASDLVVYEGEGHGLSSVANVVDCYRRIDEFLERIGVSPAV